ncbi:hypothetical protein Taro_024215 [Colocasia esculenta]|uniref:RRM domain-containing protein n=1 Tax=Colocasia esculenta TaxID=4460 RepID=A0A843V8Q9_COLES|nr:hypothetical protein [Colocasia esculenta]
MGTLDLSVKVLNISPKVTVEELCTFFSFCGTVDDIKLQREGDKDQPYSATVTFKQPYAFQTALLLDGGKPVASQQPSVTQVMVKKGHEVLNYARALDDKYKVRESGREVVQHTVLQTRTAMSAAEQTAGRMGTAFVHSSCFSKSALWVAGVLDRASKYAAALGNLKLKDETDSRKKK